MLFATLLPVAAEDPPVEAALDVPFGMRATFFPYDDIYPPYVADPHRVGFNFRWMTVADPSIPTSGNERVVVNVGAQIPVIKLESPGSQGPVWQGSFECGLDGVFDADYNCDNIGWDGDYGFALLFQPVRSFALKLRDMHNSSHVGDEYAERTGRKNSGMTYEETTLGLRWTLTPKWGVYAEGGWAHTLWDWPDIIMDRAQGGLEFESLSDLWGGRFGWYAAADIQAMEERNWRVDSSIQAGIIVKSSGRTVRLCIEHGNGRPTIREFIQNTETYTGIALCFDI